jgi:hypothetical protein
VNFLRSTILPAALLLCAGLLLAPAHAAPSTSRGNISVAQAIEMIDKAESDPAARQNAMAYLFGVGETVGFIVSQSNLGAALPKCQTSFSLDTTQVAAALRAGAPDEAQWNETMATPIIVTDLLTRAGCI